MDITTGSVLISAPLMDDPNFEKVVLFITEHDAGGALGFVINELFDRKFNELTEFRHSVPVPLYVGGPMERESLFFIHRRPDLIGGGEPVTGDIYFGGNFPQAVRYINNKDLAKEDVKLFLGYSGWDARQLEEEIAEGSWLVVKPPVDVVFRDNIGSLWDELHERTGSPG